MPVGRPLLQVKPRTSSGQRFYRVTIETLTAGTTTSGFPGGTWDPLRTVWMSKADIRADERFAAGQDSAYYETQWFAEYASDMDPELVDLPKSRRLNTRGRIYNIRAAAVVGHNQGLEITTLAQPRVDA